jgi:hypothetical protein
MSKKAALPLRIVRLQRVVGEPITDPAEQAAIDKMRKRLRRKLKKSGQNGKR